MRAAPAFLPPLAFLAFLGGFGCALFQPRPDDSGKLSPSPAEIAAAAARAALEGASKAAGEDTPLGGLLGAAGGLLGALGIGAGVHQARRTAQARNEAGKAREALAITMGGLELADTSVRHKVRDRARREGTSDYLERLVAEGWVKDLSSPAGKPEPKG